MSKFQLNLLRIFSDLFVLSIAFFLAYAVRLEFVLDYNWIKRIVFATPYVVVFEYLVMTLSGSTRGAWRYVSLQDAMRLSAALAVAGIGFSLMRIISGSYLENFAYLRYALIPWSVIIMNFVFASFGVISLRALRRLIRERKNRKASDKRLLLQGRERINTILIGAGEAGLQVVKSVKQRPDMGLLLVGFIDDDPSKLGRNIEGVRVLGAMDKLEEIMHRLEVKEAIITIANAKGEDLRKIVEKCQNANLPVKIVPKIGDLLEGKIQLSAIREVSVEDLLHRESVELDRKEISAFLHDRSILISGAGGSIGSELCRQVIAFKPKKLILLERSELFLYNIERELKKHRHGSVCVPVLADICDIERMEAVFSQYQPEVIFHAAAYKHVPMLELNPGESIRNNIWGTKIIADQALKYQSKAFVMISTDKAVNPTSIMGASKRIAELYIQSLSALGDTKFLAVRFGNVLGSTGSVVPLFKEQIAKGGPVTVTHPEMKRYFMTIPEASQLVMQAASMGSGGEIFVLDMGEAVKIVDLAKDLIRLSGKTEEDIQITFTGSRPGEKLFEELGFDEECMDKTKHPKIYVGKLQAMPQKVINEGIEKLKQLEEISSPETIRRAFHELVPEMQQGQD